MTLFFVKDYIFLKYEPSHCFKKVFLRYLGHLCVLKMDGNFDFLCFKVNPENGR